MSVKGVHDRAERMNTDGARQRGFALLAVLAAVALLSVLVMRITASGRSDRLLARNLVAAAMAEAAADGAIHEAGVRLAAHEPGWIADGRTVTVRRAGAAIDIRLGDPRGKVNPNTAPPALMEALLLRLGADPPRAAMAAAAMFDWRTPGPQAAAGGLKVTPYRQEGWFYAPSGHRFTDLDELGAVAGMTPALLAALRPYLSLYNAWTIAPEQADPLVLAALDDAGIGQPADDDPGPVALVRAHARSAAGASFTRRAALLLTPSRRGRPFRILSWESGED